MSGQRSAGVSTPEPGLGLLQAGEEGRLGLAGLD